MEEIEKLNLFEIPELLQKLQWVYDTLEHAGLNPTAAHTVHHAVIDYCHRKQTRIPQVLYQANLYQKPENLRWLLEQLIVPELVDEVEARIYTITNHKP